MHNPLDSDLIRSFLAVADTGSVTHAAARLFRTQSAVSLQIKRLEENLGQPLFLRQARGVELTPRGEQLLPYARRVVETLDARRMHEAGEKGSIATILCDSGERYMHSYFHDGWMKAHGFDVAGNVEAIAACTEKGKELPWGLAGAGACAG